LRETSNIFGHVKNVEAQQLLMEPFNSFGSFMVQYSESTPGKYSLSIRDKETGKHYHILSMENGVCSLTGQVTFETLQDVVAYYFHQVDELCATLMQTCWICEEWKIMRSQALLWANRGQGCFGKCGR